MAGIMKDANLQNVSLNSEKAIQYIGRVFIEESKRNRKPKCALSDTRKKQCGMQVGSQGQGCEEAQAEM